MGGRRSQRSSSQALPSQPRSPAPSHSTTGKTYYFIPKDTLNPYEVIADHGGKLALNELGDKQVVSVRNRGHRCCAAAGDPGGDPGACGGIVIAGNDPQARVPGAPAGPGGRERRSSPSTRTSAAGSCSSTRPTPRRSAAARSQLLGEADGLQGPVRDPVRGFDGHEPERVDQVHEARS